MSARHALKTAVAAALTMLLYQLVPMHDQSNQLWAVIAAVLVMQSNLGGSFKASWTRLQGTAIGALIGATFAWSVGHGILWVMLAVGLTVLVCTWLRLSDSLRLAGATVVLVMLASSPDGPWSLGWQRFVDTATGIAMALAAQFLVLPSRAGKELRQGLAQALEDCGELYDGIVDSLLHSNVPVPSLDDRRAKLRDQLKRNQDFLRDQQSEPMRERAGEENLPLLLAAIEDLVEHVHALEHAVRDMGKDQYWRQLEPRLSELARVSGVGFDWLANALRTSEPPLEAPELEKTRDGADAEYAALRKAGAGRPFSNEEVLRFSTFFFNLRAVAHGLLVVAEIAGWRCTGTSAEQAT